MFHHKMTFLECAFGGAVSSHSFKAWLRAKLSTADGVGNADRVGDTIILLALHTVLIVFHWVLLLMLLKPSFPMPFRFFLILSLLLVFLVSILFFLLRLSELLQFVTEVR